MNWVTSSFIEVLFIRDEGLFERLAFVILTKLQEILDTQSFKIFLNLF